MLAAGNVATELLAAPSVDGSLENTNIISSEGYMNYDCLIVTTKTSSISAAQTKTTAEELWSDESDPLIITTRKGDHSMVLLFYLPFKAGTGWHVFMLKLGRHLSGNASLFHVHLELFPYLSDADSHQTDNAEMEWTQSSLYSVSRKSDGTSTVGCDE